MKKVLFIQPHSDDILLSCFSKLSEEGIIPTILTVEFDEKRIKEDEKLKQFFPMINIIAGVKISDNSYSTYYKNPHQKFIPELVFQTIDESLGDTIFDISDIIATVIDGEDWDEIYTCMGVGHPLHWLVHELTKNDATHFYRDWPHSYKKRNSAFFDAYSKENFDFIEELGGDDQKEMKIELVKQCYKSQSSLMYFEQGNVEKHFSEKFYKSK